MSSPYDTPEYSSSPSESGVSEDEEPPTIENLVFDFVHGNANQKAWAITDAVRHPNAIDAIRALQHAGLDLNEPYGYFETALIESMGKSDAVTVYLLSEGADPNLCSRGESPLSVAAAHPLVAPSVLSELLAHGAEMAGDPALHRAAFALSLPKVRVLLEHGADPNALCLGSHRHYFEQCSTALHQAATAHCAETLDPRAWKVSLDPRAQEKLIRLLLLAGADPMKGDSQGVLPEDWVRGGTRSHSHTWKQLANPGTEPFDEIGHRRRIRALLRNRDMREAV